MGSYLRRLPHQRLCHLDRTGREPVSAGMLGQFNVALQELIDSGAWDKNDELKVCIAGTLPKDKFIVIQNITKREKK
jgi:hypothetical protein